MRTARLIKELRDLWASATREERAEIAQNQFALVRVRDKSTVSAKLASDDHLLLVASAEAHAGWEWRARRDSNPRPSDPKSPPDVNAWAVSRSD